VKTQLHTQIDIQNILSPLDWVVFISILALTYAAVVWGQLRKSKVQSEPDRFLDLLLMGRQLTLPLFVATLVATWYGGIFGVTQISFEKGIYNFITQGLFWYFAYILFAIFLVDRIRKTEAVTLPDLVGKMFGPRSRQISGVFNFFNVVPVAYVMSLGFFCQVIFGGSLVINMILATAFVCLYSIWGGFRSVVFSDLVQFSVMCSAVVAVVVFCIYRFGGVDFLVSQLPSGHFELTGGEGLATTFVWGLIALSTLVDPNFYQRVFAARSNKVARWGIFVSTAVWIGFDICTTLGGLYARALIPEADSGSAYMTMSLQVLPDGLRGFYLAGILATILSTLDSYIFTAGTTLSYDLFPRVFRNRSWGNHFGVLFVGALSIVLAVFFDGSIRAVWKTLGSYSAACLLLPMIVGFLKPGRIGDLQFFSACVLSAVAVTFWRVLPSDQQLWGLDEIYIGCFVSFSALMIFLLLNRHKAGRI